MLLPDHQYLKADSLESCLQKLRENAAMTQLVAGGTDVIFNMRLKLFKPDVALRLPPPYLTRWVESICIVCR
jgi:CO/xanthine dehydrogenase FAD-binding subunit